MDKNTSTVKAPDRIWADVIVWGDMKPLAGEWNFRDVGRPEDTEYVRADIYEALAKERDELEEVCERLRLRVTELKRFIPDAVVRCRGDKCREPWCASCYGWEYAEEYIAALQRKEGDE